MTSTTPHAYAYAAQDADLMTGRADQLTRGAISLADLQAAIQAHRDAANQHTNAAVLGNLAERDSHREAIARHGEDCDALVRRFMARTTV